MGRPRKYNTPEEAHEAKLAQAREKYRQSRIGVERKKWGFVNTVITPDMVGKTIKELELEYKANKAKKEIIEEPNRDISRDLTQPSQGKGEEEESQNEITIDE